MTNNDGTYDACDLLKADHRTVKQLFTEYDALTRLRAQAALEQRTAIAHEICIHLTVHATIEEEIFYPAVRAALPDKGLIDAATVEHATAKQLIAQLEAGSPEDALYDAKVAVLGDYIEHHVREEENEIFPRARAARSLDLVSLRRRLEQRKMALMERVNAPA